MQRHRCRSKFPMNAPAITDIAMTQRRRFGANIPIIVFAIVNVSGTQHRAFYDDYSIHVFDIINALMMQLGTSCSFDSPGLARDEPTPGKRSQGDSTP
ncbi:hypothetical protein [Segatella salivae]|nr:hypothetical protein [Segatella salivae]